MSSTPGKTAPRLLQDLLTYDPRFEERAGRNLLTTSPPHYDPDTRPTPAVPFRNCRHSFLTKPEQSQLPRAGEDATHDTIYKISSFCQKCRWHLDLVVDFRDDGDKSDPCMPLSREYPIHHFLLNEDRSDLSDPFRRANSPRNYKFCCSAPKCPVELRIRLLPPRITDPEIVVLTDRGHLRRRLEAAKQLAGERADPNMARSVDALDFLSTYLQDSLNPKQGKSRIPLMNRKFLKTFGKDCDHILKKLGFTHAVEVEDDGDTVDVWYLPRPPAASHPLAQEITTRTVVEDARYELNALISEYPEHERTAVRHPMIPAQPSITDIQRALGCLDYDKKPGRETRSTNHEEDHPYYAGLGAVGDFSDALLLFAYARQVKVDIANASYYFECLQDIAIGRKSDELGTQVMVLASRGQTNRREVAAAYKYFGMDMAHAGLINDEHIIGTFKSRLQDSGTVAAEESRKQLRIIGNARGSDKIKQVASDAIETYEQALEWLDLDASQPDDFVTTMYTVKVAENPNNTKTALKAVEIIAKQRNSYRLRDFLKNGFMDEGTGMDVAEAYAILDIADRVAPLDLEVLQGSVNIMTTDTPERQAKIQQAFELVCKDQKENHNNLQTFANRSAMRKYPLDSWPVGMKNIGNTCYLNSVLQFLFTVKPLRDTVLDPENFVQASSPQALENKIVGRSAVQPEKLEKAQQFVHELRNLFHHMITDSEYVVQPETKLAILALAERTGSTEIKAVEYSTHGSGGLGNIGGIAIAGPMLPPESVSEVKPVQPINTLADSVMGDDDAKSDTSTTAMVDVTEAKPEPPSRPPPVPPRPQPDKTITTIERNAQQQDAAEIMNNIFDLLSCALKGDGVWRDGEQFDLIKKLFFSDVTTVRRVEQTSKHNSAIQDNHLISPGGRNRSLYAALDDEFSMTEVENDTSKGVMAKTYKYEYIEEASPIQIINVRRLIYEGGQSRKDESHIALDEVLYLDRYLKKTNSLSEKQLLELREKQWRLQQKLRTLEARKKELRETELKMTLPDAVNEAANFVEKLSKASEEQLIDVEYDPTVVNPELPAVMREQALELQKEAGSLETHMQELDEEINSIYKDCKDHPYRLHAVFMHRGGPNSGHYWIYIYDFQKKLWRKYNDEEVDDVGVEKVYEHEERSPQTSTGIVYIREDLVSELTEAVHRTLNITPLNEVEMKDADEIGFDNVVVIEGIEKD